MPQVGKGGQKFPYTPTGEAAAKKKAAKTGKPLINTQKKGGRKPPKGPKPPMAPMAPMMPPNGMGGF